MDARSEVITIFVGQAGVQLANACWELFCLEHGVTPTGCLCPGYYPVDIPLCTFFAEIQSRRMSPRTIIVDTEPTVVDEIRCGPYRRLFRSESLISGKEDASNNYARGFHTLGRETIDIVMQRVCKLLNECQKPAGFILFRSMSGGTGSGFATLLVQRLKQDCPKLICLDVAIYPSPCVSNVIVEPYNALFTTHGVMDHVDCCIFVENEALYNICDSELDVANATYKNLNRLVAQVISNLTASMRFGGALNITLNELKTNLVPYPRNHFTLATYAPLLSPEKAMHADISTKQITNDCFQPLNQLVSCDPRTGAYSSCCLLYRGDVNPNDVSKTIGSLKGNRSIRFVTWSSTGFKVGINNQPAVTVPGGDLAKCRRTVAMASNNTAIRHRWSMLVQDFDLLHRKRAYVHHYVGEGMEESFFQETQEDVAALIDDYREIER